MFNQLPLLLRNTSVCSVYSFKKKLDLYLSTVPDFLSSGCLTGSWSVWAHAVTPHSTIYHLVFLILTVVKIWSTGAVQNR